MIYRKRDKAFFIVSFVSSCLNIIVFFYLWFSTILVGLLGFFDIKSIYESLFSIYIYAPFFGFLTVMYLMICKMLKDYDVYFHNYEKISKALTLEKDKKYTQEEINKLVKKSSK